MKKGKERGLNSRRVELRDELQGREQSSLSNLLESKRRVWVWEICWAKRDRNELSVE